MRADAARLVVPRLHEDDLGQQRNAEQQPSCRSRAARTQTARAGETIIVNLPAHVVRRQASTADRSGARPRRVRSPQKPTPFATASTRARAPMRRSHHNAHAAPNQSTKRIWSSLSAHQQRRGDQRGPERAPANRQRAGKGQQRNERVLRKVVVAQALRGRREEIRDREHVGVARADAELARQERERNRGAATASTCTTISVSARGKTATSGASAASAHESCT